MFDFLKPKKEKLDIALLVDGPNILRKAFNVDLHELRKEISRFGNIRIAKIYLDQFASDKLIEAMVNQGFETEITTGDVDVTMAIEAMEYVLDKDVDIIALMTRDTDYLPVLRKAKARGKKTMIIATDVAFSAALRNTADRIIIYKGPGKIETIVNNE
ncbi:NYN domain protein [Candidatus Bilamarchaeum dharawalense]|uniref:NYN domain protein n=1 Tax=Candidatus Bilamarchaeum dharawalense TaxID=2885759 RepID=A0A5E4LQA6_9ARCH|nr:NYN domain protein [Candidatus Bilamarchaeum dharawalense]